MIVGIRAHFTTSKAVFLGKYWFLFLKLVKMLCRAACPSGDSIDYLVGPLRSLIFIPNRAEFENSSIFGVRLYCFHFGDRGYCGLDIPGDPLQDTSSSQDSRGWQVIISFPASLTTWNQMWLSSDPVVWDLDSNLNVGLSHSVVSNSLWPYG